MAAFGGPEAQPPQVPAFKSGVELIAVDVSVVDKAGHPIRSLPSDQFDVRIDGQPRRVVSAELVDHVPAAGAARPGRRRTSRARLQFERRAWQPGGARPPDVHRGGPGQLPAGWRTRRDGGGAPIHRRLQPQDRIGLAHLPSAGPAVAASRNHAAVREALQRVVGVGESLASSASASSASRRPSTSRPGTRGASEGERAGNARVREAPWTARLQGEHPPGGARHGDRAEDQARRDADGLRGLVAGLAAIQERKTLVLIAGACRWPTGSAAGWITQAEIASIATRSGRHQHQYLHPARRLHLPGGILRLAARTNETLARDIAMSGRGWR